MITMTTGLINRLWKRHPRKNKKVHLYITYLFILNFCIYLINILLVLNCYAIILVLFLSFVLSDTVLRSISFFFNFLILFCIQRISTTNFPYHFTYCYSIFFLIFTVLEYEQVYLSNLPCCECYEKSYMHRDVITHIVVTKLVLFFLFPSKKYLIIKYEDKLFCFVVVGHILYLLPVVTVT